MGRGLYGRSHAQKENKMTINSFYSLQCYVQKSDDSMQKKDQLKGISGLVSLAIWIIAIMFLLDNLGVKISAVVVGFGIGGIAVALAAKAVLGDLFSYFVIFFNKPFESGDFIMVGDKIGVIEHIGIKYVNGEDYNLYIDIQQSINLAIFEAFEKEGIEFADPTQTLFVHKNTE